MEREREVYFQLINEDGSKLSTCYSVPCAEDAKVRDLQRMLKCTYSTSYLAEISAPHLTVYVNQAAFNDHSSFKYYDPLGNIGESEEQRLIVVVPEAQPSKRQRTEHVDFNQASELCSVTAFTRQLQDAEALAAGRLLYVPKPVFRMISMVCMSVKSIGTFMIPSSKH